MEANKGSGRGGWLVIAPGDGWALTLYTRGPFHSLRAAIDAAMSSVEQNETAPNPFPCVECGKEFEGTGRLCARCFAKVKL